MSNLRFVKFNYDARSYLYDIVKNEWYCETYLHHANESIGYVLCGYEISVDELPMVVKEDFELWEDTIKNKGK